MRHRLGCRRLADGVRLLVPPEPGERRRPLHLAHDHPGEQQRRQGQEDRGV